MKVLLKPKVTKPWSTEMYDYNDKVAELMKENIRESIKKNKNNFDKLNELIVLCGGLKHSTSFDLSELYDDVLSSVDDVQNYWLNEEYDYAVKQGLVKDVLYKMVGYGK